MSVKQVITFIPLKESHFPLLLKWLEMPHVKAWWDQDVTYTIDLVKEKFGKHTHNIALSKNSNNKTYAYIICLDKEMIGYIQAYNAPDFAHEKNCLDLSAISGSICGVDLFIGDSKFLHKGIGAQILNEFERQILASHFDWCLIDPAKDNLSAIKSFTKAGFKVFEQFQAKSTTWMMKEILNPVFSINKVELQEITKWAKNVLAEKGYTLQGEPKMVRTMPWSTVISFQTDQGKIYLKSMAKAFSYEPALLSFLTQDKMPHLPIILAINVENQCFLMEDAGCTLRPLLKESYDVSIVKSALPAYAQLQQKCIQFTNSLLDLGILDFRLNNLPSLYDSFLQNPEPLLSDGLKQEEITLLQNHRATFAKLCQALKDFQIPETLEQGDFHDNNILVKNGKVTFSDFGDAAIAHPFFSIASFLNSAERHHVLKASDQIYSDFLDIYLNEWKAYGTKDELNNAFNLAYTLRPFVWALSFIRIKSCPGIESFSQYSGYLADSLKTLLNNLIKGNSEIT